MNKEDDKRNIIFAFGKMLRIRDIEGENRQDKLKYRDSKSLLFILRLNVNNKERIVTRVVTAVINEECLQLAMHFVRVYI